MPIARALDLGAAYGTAKSGVGISSMGVMNPGLVMRNIIPVVMAGVLGIYGLIVSVILIQQGTLQRRKRCNDARGVLGPRCGSGLRAVCACRR